MLLHCPFQIATPYIRPNADLGFSGSIGRVMDKPYSPT
jgi:hypothetical protein